MTESPSPGVALCLHFPMNSFVQVCIVPARPGEALIRLPAPAHTRCAQQRRDTSFKFGGQNSHRHVSHSLFLSSHLERGRRARARSPQLTGATPAISSKGPDGRFSAFATHNRTSQPIIHKLFYS